METALKYILVFAAGAGVGFLVAKKIFDEPAIEQDDDQEELDRINANIRRRAEGRTSNEPRNEVDEHPYLQKSSLEGTCTNKYNQIKRDYGIISRSKEEEDTDPSDENNDDDPNKVAFVGREDPYIIDDVQFAEEFNNFDKITLYFYQVDGILADDDETPIDDIEQLIGWEALALLDTENTVWVRNEKISSDYEVVPLNQSYQEMILGEQIYDRPPHDIGRHKNKRKDEDNDD